MKKYAKIIIMLISMLFSINVFSQANDANLRDFVKGNLSEKSQIINTANNDGNTHEELWAVALDFINANYSLLFDDEEYISLARSLVQKSSENNLTALVPKLESLFTLTSDPALLLDLLTVFSTTTIQNNELITLVNDYAQSLLDSGTESQKDILYLTIEVLGNIADPSSFSVLFQAYAYSDDEDISNAALQSLTNLKGGNENYIRSLIEKGTPSEKYYTLLIVLKNTRNSDFFKAEMSEKALSSTIINIGDVSTVDEFTIALQMEAIRELVRISWTRSASLITDYFFVAKEQFEAGFLPDESFVEVIKAFTELSSGNAGQHLSEYLEELNMLQEENKTYSDSIVLAVIQSLGMLGDKVAFDALLYTTYLEYPENIILAARDALVTLKW